MNSQNSPSALSQNCKISLGLCRFDDTKRVSLTRNWQVVEIVTCDLEEDAAIWATLVDLPGRMEEPGTESNRSRDVLAVPDCLSNLVETGFVLSIHFSVCKNPKIVACDDTIQMRTEVIGQHRLAGGDTIENRTILSIRVQANAITLPQAWCLGQSSGAFIR